MAEGAKKTAGARQASPTRLAEYLPFHRPYMGEEEIAEVVDTLRSGWLTLGPKTLRFEEKFADYVGAEHAVGVSSCTAALHLSLEALGVGPGDEVIVSPYTFTASVAAVLYAGATPVLADTMPDYPNLDPRAVADKVTDRTRAIIPVHFAGAPCDLDALRAIADRAGAVIVEDAAHSLPAAYRGRRIGSISEATAFSFYAGKNMTTGEGGMITTNDGALAEVLRSRRLHGISRDAWKRYTAEGSWFYEVGERGFKYNMTDINAAIGLHQLDRLDGFHARRLELVALYDELLAPLPGVSTPRAPEHADSSWHLYVVGVDPEVVGRSRNNVIEALGEDNIGTSVHFIPIHYHRFYQDRLGCTKDDFPRTNRHYESAISLPLFPTMKDEDVRAAAGSLARIVTEIAK
jgi:dTDP-4-amino-4,6-dideoxygalactose transaminase